MGCCSRKFFASFKPCWHFTSVQRPPYAAMAIAMHGSPGPKHYDMKPPVAVLMVVQKTDKTPI